MSKSRSPQDDGDQKTKTSLKPSRTSRASRHYEEDDDMITSLKPPPRKPQVEKATMKDDTLPDMTEDVDYSVGSLEEAKQINRHPSDYTVASSKGAKNSKEAYASVRDKFSAQASNNAMAKDPVLKPSPQVAPGAYSVPGIATNPNENDELFDIDMESARHLDIEARTSVVYDAGEQMVSAYAVDDYVHEAKLVDVKKKRLHRCLWTTAIVAIVLVAVVTPIVHLTRKDDGNSDTIELQFDPIIMDLCSPRHLKVYNNQLFVAEAGVGSLDPETTCLPHLTKNVTQLCFGTTGKVSMFHLDNFSAGEPPLTGLTSGRDPQSNQVYGAAAVDFDKNGNMFTLVGLGFVSAMELDNRTDLVFASVLRGNETVASPWIPLHAKNYSGHAVIETNPFHMLIHSNGFTYVVDAGADLLYTYRDVGTAGSTEPDDVIVLPMVQNITATKPDPRNPGPCDNVTPPNGPTECGQYIGSNGEWQFSTGAVPTAVRVNPLEPDRLYVSYLAGAPRNEPVSGIFYMDLVAGIPQNDTLKVIKGDFWAIIDFGFYQGDLFVLETNPGGSVPFDGRLSRVSFDSDEMTNMTHIPITTDLFLPVGMFIDEDTGTLFVSNNTFNKGMDDCTGQILKASLS